VAGVVVPQSDGVVDGVGPEACPKLIIGGRPWRTYVDGQEAQRISHLLHANGTEAGRERGRATTV